ncbi:MAG: MBL fold metallo-hydrolase [Dehalococcoidia bacterium]|nr:MBL fold metallo-hydrolase [Dehalococcoidia bacterium]
MKVKWLGHASFLITSGTGTRIITDPYTAGGPLKYAEIKEAADVVTVSHEHFDHNNIASVAGKPEVFKGPAPMSVKDVKFSGVATHHDENKGKDRGNNMIICMEVDGMRVCHLGDLGHNLSSQEASQVGKVDVLLAPVGGFYTIDAAVATDVSNKLQPKVIIPMHFKNDRCGFPVAGVDEFLKDKKNVTLAPGSEVEFQAGKLPAATQIIVLKPAL